MPAPAVPPAPPSREPAALKANRLLCEGRLIVVEARAGFVAAICRGEGSVHHLGFAHGGWHCSCEHMGSRCSHILALKKVVAVDL
jgi:hypothetical protein